MPHSNLSKGRESYIASQKNSIRAAYSENAPGRCIIRCDHNQYIVMHSFKRYVWYKYSVVFATPDFVAGAEKV